MRILVVEDDVKIASFVSKGLRESGFAVDRAGDGEEALHLALCEPYDAAVVDIMLPKLDGLALIEEIIVGSEELPERQKVGGRQGKGASDRGRRLFDQTFFFFRTPGPGARVDQTCNKSC